MKSLNFKLTLFIVVFIVTLVSIYFLTLEMGSCVIYAEQIDQITQNNNQNYHFDDHREKTPEELKKEQYEWEDEVFRMTLIACASILLMCYVAYIDTPLW